MKNFQEKSLWKGIQMKRTIERETHQIRRTFSLHISFIWAMRNPQGNRINYKTIKHRRGLHEKVNNSCKILRS